MSSSGTPFFDRAEEPSITPEEKSKVQTIASQAFVFLTSQEGQEMNLGDFVAEMRDFDIRTVVIDEVMTFMTANKWVYLWLSNKGGAGDYWVIATHEKQQG